MRAPTSVAVASVLVVSGQWRCITAATPKMPSSITGKWLKIPCPPKNAEPMRRDPRRAHSTIPRPRVRQCHRRKTRWLCRSDYDVRCRHLMMKLRRKHIAGDGHHHRPCKISGPAPQQIENSPPISSNAPSHREDRENKKHEKMMAVGSIVAANAAQSPAMPTHPLVTRMF